MKRKKSKLLIVLIPLLTMSCGGGGGGPYYSYNDGSNSNYTSPIFNFFEEIDTIMVDETVKSFELGGVLSEEPDPQDYPYSFPVNLDTIRTTARHRVHFINNVSYKYDRKDGWELYQTIKLIPEGIKEEVQLVYFRENYISGALKVDSTIIRLIPKITTPKLKKL